MINIVNPSEFYHSRIKQLEIELNILLKKRTRIAWLRFGAVVLGFLTGYLLLPQGIGIALASFGFFLFVFIWLILADTRNKEKIENTSTLININKEEIKITEHHFTHLPDGHSFLPASHAYAVDLDIFGRASLYQYINRTQSEQGNKILAGWLLEPASRQNILQRQEAVKELCGQTEWRQQLQALGSDKKITIATQQKIHHWLQEETHFISNKKWNLIRWLLPSFIISALILTIAGIIPNPVFYGIAFLFFIIAGSISKKIMPLYDSLNKIALQIETLSDTATWIEKGSFKSRLLIYLQKHFYTNNQKASTDIKKLKKLLDRFDLRMNPLVFIPLNTLLLWDLQQAFELEKWKNRHKTKATKWFEAAAEMEAVSSLSTLAFNQPEWCYPILSDEPGTLITEELGHPLIEALKRVNNSFSTIGLNQLALVTGSNMAGKSTFLRSIGINIVLAMAGSPVCAKKFTLYPVKVMSSMRIADNLEESTSTFYAELKKLKSIIEAVNRKEEIFILLDEILRGTNSMDRHTGSKALIKQLIRQEATGIIATHDLELAQLAGNFPANIHNYHFDVQVNHDELYFDYKLKKGICQSLNASILMKKIGIEI